MAVVQEVPAWCLREISGGFVLGQRRLPPRQGVQVFSAIFSVISFLEPVPVSAPGICSHNACVDLCGSGRHDVC
jgi:hypothetical protein